MDDLKLLTEKEVARQTGLSLTWLQHRRLDGGGPPFVRIGRSVRYPASDLHAWCEALERYRGTTHDPRG